MKTNVSSVIRLRGRREGDVKDTSVSKMKMERDFICTK